jgi:DNA-binding beta-propeller fold protein YncE
VSVINAATNTVTATIPVDGALGVAFSPDGTFAYVTNDASDTVSVISIGT